MRHINWLPVLLVALADLLGTARAQETPRYAVLKLTDLGGDVSTTNAVNSYGHVAGSAFLTPDDFHPALWISENEPIDLGTLGGTDGTAWGINSSDWVVGRNFQLAYREYRGFLWRDGVMEDLGSLGGDWVEAFGINEAGEIVGFSDTIPGQTSFKAFRWSNGIMEALPELEDGIGGWAYSINDEGQIVGQSGSTEYGGWRAVLWENGEITDLGTLMADNTSESSARDINNLGQIVGWSFADGTTEMRAFLWADGRMYNLGKPLGAKGAVAYGINDHTQVVGRGYAKGVKGFGFIWEQGRGMRQLDDLLPPQMPWRTWGAWDINNAGQIAADGFSVPFEGLRGALLSPVYPTMEMSAPTPGVAGAMNTFEVTDANPGANVVFTYSLHGGGFRIPGCDLQQNALQLENPKIVGSAIADANGNASIQRFVPKAAAGKIILFQAVVVNDCAISQLVGHQFE